MRRSRGISTKIRVSPESLLEWINRLPLLCDGLGWTYTHIMPKRMMMSRWMRLDMPTARQSNMHSTPSLWQVLATLPAYVDAIHVLGSE